MNEDLKDVVNRIADLESEVHSLKQQLSEIRKSETTQTTQTHSRKTVFVQPTSVVGTKEPSLTSQDETPVMKQPKREIDFEKELGIWLPRVFMFILLLGVLWGLKVGMDYGVITDSVRVGLGYAGTGVLYFLGMRYMEAGKNGFGLTLLGGFIALGILTTFASHHLYGYLNFYMALLVGIAYIATGLWLSMKTKSETLTIFSAIAGFLLPFLLEGEGATAIQFCLYMLLVFMSLFYVSLRQKHKYTFYVTFLLFHLALGIYVLLENVEGSQMILVGTVLIQHLTFVFFYLKGRISRQVFSEALLYTNFVFLIAWIKLLTHQQEVILYGGVAALYVALAVYIYSKKDILLQGVLSAVAVFAISVFILSFNYENDQVKMILLLINGAVGLWVGLRYKTLRTVYTSLFVYLITAQFVLILPFLKLASLDHAVWLVFIGTLVWIYYSFYQFPPTALQGGKGKRIDMALIIGQLVVMLYLYNVVRLLLDASQLSSETIWHVFILVFIAALCAMYPINEWKHGLYVAHAVVVEYLVLGLGVLVIGLSNHYSDGGFGFNLSIQLLYLAILTLMFVAFMKDGFYLTKQQLKMSGAKLAIVMQVVYFIFLNKWYFAIVNVNNWTWEYVLLVHTFLLFTFAFLSISIGRKLNWKHVKIIGVALIGICILKLFIVDLASISILIRAILFTVVGIVGLFYSRTMLKE